jgi:hypothetical protein
MEWRRSGSPRPKIFRVQKFAGKFSASVFLVQDGILLIDYLPKPNYKRRVLLISAGAIEGHFEGNPRGKLNKFVLFLHKNAPAHRTLVIQKKMAYLPFHCLDHPPYTPDLAPSDYHLFSGLKKQLKVAIFHPTRRS